MGGRRMRLLQGRAHDPSPLLASSPHSCPLTSWVKGSDVSLGSIQVERELEPSGGSPGLRLSSGSP